MGPALEEIAQIRSGIARRGTPHRPGARFVVVDGRGHDLAQPVRRPIIETRTEHFALARAR